MKPDLESIAKRIRREVVVMNSRSHASHSGSALSAVDILTFLYFEFLKINPKKPTDKDRDIFILSKGHASSALYATLALNGFFPLKWLEKFYQNEGILPGHIDKDAAPGLECAAGSLGHGLSVGLGMALGSQKLKSKSKTVVMISDGELNEGSIWEPILLAPQLKLNNLTVVVDYNKIQSFGRTKEIIDLDPLAEKMQAMNWHVEEINGHDFKQIRNAFSKTGKKPTMIIANTVKGKGVSFMENKLEWHYRSPNAELLQQALEELQ